MYEVWVSEGGSITRLARFRLLADALLYIDGHRDERSFAVRLPDGAWYRDPDTGRSILGRGAADGVPEAVDDDEEITQPLTVGAAMRRSATGPIVCPPPRDEEPTDVEWPPLEPLPAAHEGDFAADRTPI